MQTQKRILVLCILIVSSVCHPGPSLGQESPCDATKSEQLATAYALALFYPERFVNYVEQEGAALSSSSFRRCIEGVRNAFSIAAINMPSSQEIHERSMSIASRAGAPHFGPEVARNIMQSQGNYALVAEALAQLSRVLGGELAYEDTIMYQNVVQREYLGQLYELLGGEAELPGFWDRYTQISFEVTRSVMESVARSITITDTLSDTYYTNTLSDTYYQAFVNPHGFDGYLNDEVILNPDYYDRFENCSQLAFGILEEMEKQLRQRYSECPNNSVCTQIAKDITSVISLRHNVENLVRFIRATRSDAECRFLESDIGRVAINVYNFHIKVGIDLPQNPEFVKQIQILSSTPCQ